MANSKELSMICFSKRLLKYLFYFISVIAVLATVLIVYLIWFQPAFNFPKPTGQNAIGNTNCYFKI